MARGNIYDFPLRGKIYLKPFFCLKKMLWVVDSLRILLLVCQGPLLRA